jgi:hypothetical protein
MRETDYKTQKLHMYILNWSYISENYANVMQYFAALLKRQYFYGRGLWSYIFIHIKGPYESF